MLQWAALVITLIILIILMIKKPLWLVPLLAVAVALEVSKTFYPDLGIIGNLIGEVTLTRFTCIALILAAAFRVIVIPNMRRKLLDVIKDPLTIILLVYLVLGAISTVYSADIGRTLIETVRLVILFAVFVSIALLLDKKHFLLPFHAVHITALFLVVFALYEAFSGNHIWQSTELAAHTLRANATFVDPNIFARYIILGISANFIIQLYTREKRIRYLCFIGLAVMLAELVLTGSRGGFVTLAVVLIAALILLPNKKVVLSVIGLGILCGGIILFIRPDIAERLMVLTKGLGVSDPTRLYLWKAAIAIFTDHPIIGTGLGTFQTVFLSDYAHLKTVADGVTLSHTTVLTIAAELGIIGLLVLAVLWVTIMGRLYRFYRFEGNYLTIYNNYNSIYEAGAGYLLWIVTVFISSQAEGRFFEDPMLWLSCACLVMLRMSGKRNIYSD
ncbi:O-antigen ligase family protein [Dehalobacter sp. DCM]|uniref:O-antigen ligase family protein n=1 Tax=Dehalobacter sp. DCM TaxID=2907827 RepID=UPI003081D699|nr:O-antigen ligase family protein [Dehalobacter sp. DCM]